MVEPLPNAELAFIDSRKLRDYVLNPQHRSGGYKAVFFLQMGYSRDDWQQLERDIRDQHLVLPARTGQPSLYGAKFTITGPLKGPLGVTRQVTTVWIFRPGNDFAELVTIEPAARLRRG